MQFLSTPSARRATQLTQAQLRLAEDISIHALREEGDRWSARQRPAAANFYPRPPRGGRQQLKPRVRLQTRIISIHALREEGDADAMSWRQIWRFNFYPRPPRGGRPTTLHEDGAIDNDFYPRPPRGGRLAAHTASQTENAYISIHALREEGDASDSAALLARQQNISIHALREEGDVRLGRTEMPDYMQISIHALREEGDSKNRDKISIFL